MYQSLLLYELMGTSMQHPQNSICVPDPLVLIVFLLVPALPFSITET